MNKREKHFMKLESELEKNKQKTLSNDMKRLIQKIESYEDSAGDRLIYDSVTFTLPLDSIYRFPRFRMIDLAADYYGLECLVSEMDMNGCTPNEGSVNERTETEVRAVGNINYMVAFDMQTYFNNGAGNCDDVVEQKFTNTGTVCVNQTLCNRDLDDENPCPDFCNDNMDGFAFIRDIHIMDDNKAMIMVGVVFFLPRCNDPDPCGCKRSCTCM